MMCSFFKEKAVNKMEPELVTSRLESTGICIDILQCYGRS